MKSLIVVLVLCISIGSATAQSKVKPRKNLKASFCGIEPSESMQQANATFTESFFFTLDQSLKPSPAKRILGKFIELERASNCFQSWKFENFTPDTRFRIFMTWVHGYGWKPMIIRADEFQTTVPWKRKTQ